MNLGKRVVEHLERLASKGSQHIDAVILNSPEQGFIVGVPAEGQEPGAAISLAAYDRYSVALRHLEVTCNNLSPAKNGDEAYLRHCVEQVIRRLTYLEEPLALLELDADEKLAQLRSDPPYHDKQRLTYWEALIWANPHPRARLTRYRWQPGNQDREAIVYPATFATLGRIAQDLALSLTLEE